MPILDQGELGSCVWNAIASANRYTQAEQKIETWTCSRLFGYYETRKRMDMINEDSGCVIRDAFKVINKVGAIPEREWPYNIEAFTSKPDERCYRHAAKHQSIVYARVPQNLFSLKAVLFEGYPVVFGFMVYESIDDPDVVKTGRIPMPHKKERALGGHAVLMVGWDDDMKCFLVQNSWGTGWGDGGFCWLPFKYATNLDLASDFWTLKRVEDGK
jgi:C1A family cysteine protease